MGENPVYSEPDDHFRQPSSEILNQKTVKMSTRRSSSRNKEEPGKKVQSTIDRFFKSAQKETQNEEPSTLTPPAKKSKKEEIPDKKTEKLEEKSKKSDSDKKKEVSTNGKKKEKASTDGKKKEKVSTDGKKKEQVSSDGKKKRKSF